MLLLLSRIDAEASSVAICVWCLLGAAGLPTQLCLTLALQNCSLAFSGESQLYYVHAACFWIGCRKKTESFCAISVCCVLLHVLRVCVFMVASKTSLYYYLAVSNSEFCKTYVAKAKRMMCCQSQTDVVSNSEFCQTDVAKASTRRTLFVAIGVIKFCL